MLVLNQLENQVLKSGISSSSSNSISRMEDEEKGAIQADYEQVIYDIRRWTSKSSVRNSGSDVMLPIYKLDTYKKKILLLLLIFMKPIKRISMINETTRLAHHHCFGVVIDATYSVTGASIGQWGRKYREQQLDFNNITNQRNVEHTCSSKINCRSFAWWFELYPEYLFKWLCENIIPN